MKAPIIQDLQEMNQKIMEMTGVACDFIFKHGHAKAGHNGPYGTPETPVRNTAYWLMTFCFAYRRTGEARFLAAAKCCADYLMDGKRRPEGGAFVCNPSGWEKWNGLISQAWVLDALCEVNGLTGDAGYLAIAEEVFLLHEFDQERGLWKKLGLDSTPLGEDKIAHHQLWFAAVGARLAKATLNREIQQQVERFLEKADDNLLTYRKGLIMQRIMPEGKRGGLWISVLRIFVYVKRGMINPLLGRGLRRKEKGYHVYNLYAFAMLKKAGFGKEIFRTRRFQRMLAYGFSDEILKSYENPRTDRLSPPFECPLSVNRYAYPYSAPGFAMPYIYDAFQACLSEADWRNVKRAASRQMEVTFSDREGRFARNTEDAETLSARAYQFLRE